MSRYKPDLTVRDTDFDPDEAATFKGSLSFMASQRVAYHIGEGTGIGSRPDSLERAEEAVGHMGAVLLELLESWTLRKPGVPYAPGVERERWPLDLESVTAQPTETIVFLYQEGLKRFQPKPDGDEIITPAAASEGLQPG